MVKYRIQNVDEVRFFQVMLALLITCLLYTSDAADEL